MAKRVDNDATQEVSASMLVPDKRPPAAKPPVYGNVPKNDASMWMQQPVSADDFVSAPRKKPVAPGGGGRAFIVAVLVAAFVAVSGAGVWFAFLRESDVKPAAFDNMGKPSSPAPSPAVAPSAVTDAAVTVAVTADAAAATVDAGTLPGVAALQADAISGADPMAKKTKKRATTKKTVTKKKTATAPKKRK